MSRRVEQLGVGYYKLKINDAGTIELNAGATGNITVVGNLNVSGNTTTVGSQNLEINDNTITLNKGEAGNGKKKDRFLYQEASKIKKLAF